MNIVVIGGGKPGKFGNDFCNRARSEGHDVYVISHKDYGTNDPKHVVAPFNNVGAFLEAFKNLTKDLDTIDILLYNSNANSYPGRPDELQSTGSVSLEKWVQAMTLNAVIPHSVSLEALKKMSKGSGIVFMTSGMSYDLSRKDWTANVGYAGFKGVQNHLMIGLANHNDKGAVVTCVSPHFPYDNAEKYSMVFNHTYNYITTLTEESNGKIRGIWDNTPKYMN
jgi:hypothetical protein